MTEGYGAVKIKTYIVVVHMSPESYSHFQERKFLPEFRICPIFKLKYMSPDSYSHIGCRGLFIIPPTFYISIQSGPIGQF